MNFNLTESAIARVKEILDEENNPAMMLRVISWANDWGFQLDDTLSDEDTLIEISGIKVVLTPNAVDCLREATVSFREYLGFVFEGAVAPNQATVCHHLTELPCMPNRETLKTMRKGLRKQMRPDPGSVTTGRHDKIGEFAFEQQPDGAFVTWQLAGEPSKHAKFNELCLSEEREMDRLELGWMIANMALLDMLHELEDARSIPDPNNCTRAVNQVMGYFGKIVKRWRHWAIVPAGHMLS